MLPLEVVDLVARCRVGTPDFSGLPRTSSKCATAPSEIADLVVR